ncbi:MAG: tyrosine recombinase [Phycisphaerales bacterium]|nr:tyrosine recombinase [Phycisphaerales bacterium]
MAQISNFAQPVRDFLAHLKVEAGLAPATLEAYARDLRELTEDLERQGLTDLKDTGPQHLAEHIRYLSRDRELQPTSITRHLATMRVFYRWLNAMGRIEGDPARLLERPTRWKKIPNVLSPREMRALVEAPSPDNGRLWIRDRAILEVMYAAGLRASEVGAMRLDELHEELAMVTVTGKGSKQRVVPIGDPALEWALRYLHEIRPTLVRHQDKRDRQRLFLSFSGRPLERVAIWQIVRKYAKVANLENAHPHALRHSFATHMLVGGADLRVVQELLGHTDIGTTQVYTHVDRSQLKDVVRGHHPRP